MQPASNAAMPPLSAPGYEDGSWSQSPSLPRLPSGQRHTADTAVVVGISDYLVLPDVPYADRDADAFVNWLVYPRGVPLDRVHQLKAASKEHIEKAVQRAGQDVEEGGTVWVYFAGHGAADPSTTERILLGDDTRSDTTSFTGRGVAVKKRPVWLGPSSTVLSVGAEEQGPAFE